MRVIDHGDFEPAKDITLWTCVKCHAIFRNKGQHTCPERRTPCESWIA